MRIMTDTNIIISAFLFPNSVIRKLLEKIVVQDQLILCPFIIEELYAVFKRKFPEEIDSLDFFLSELAFELVYTPKRINVSDYPDIRDENDLPILVSAIMGEVDVFITGDKDFCDIPKILETPYVLVENDDYRSPYLEEIRNFRNKTFEISGILQYLSP